MAMDFEGMLCLLEHSSTCKWEVSQESRRWFFDVVLNREMITGHEILQERQITNSWLCWMK